MKAILGALVLLLVLGVVGFVAVRQLKSMSAARTTAATGSGPALPRAVEDQFRRDLDHAMQAASAARAVD